MHLLGQGEFTLYLGPMVQGKRFFFKILSGVYSSDSGIIHLNGQDFNPLSPREALSLGIAYAPQIPYSPSHLTVSQFEKLTDLSLAGSNGFFSNGPKRKAVYLLNVPH